MGLEYIVQPQVFLGGLTALGPGIQNLTESYPLLTTYYSWTSTASADASVFPIPIQLGSMYDGPYKEASFIVSVGGVIQPPTEYTINNILRTITFSSAVSAGIEIAVTQLATAAPSSQNLNFLRSVSAEFTTLTAIDGSFGSLAVTNLTAFSTIVNGSVDVITNISGGSVISKVTNTSNTVGSQARFDLATGTPNAYSILFQQDGPAPYGEYSHGPALTGGMFFTAASASPIIFRQDNSPVKEAMRINTEGNIGIGATDPKNRLSVRDGDISLIAGENLLDAGRSIRFFANAQDDTANNYAEIKGGAINAGVSPQQGYLRFNTSGTERMRILAGGNVGIGTLVPNQLLTVAGNISATGNILAAGNITVTGSIVGSNTDTYFVLSGSRITSTTTVTSYFDPTISIPLLANKQYTLQYDLYHSMGATPGSILFALSTTNSSVTASANFTHIAALSNVVAPVMNGFVGRVGPFIAFSPLPTLSPNLSSYTRINTTLELGATPATLLLAVSGTTTTFNALRGSKRVLTLLN